MTFSDDQMTAFLNRVRRYLERQGGSPVTLSKKLFGGPTTLPGLLSKTADTSFGKLVTADERLADLEAQLEPAE